MGSTTAIAPSPQTQEIRVPFETHVLENGLRVVVHEDHTSPVVAVFVSYHVGSAREEAGKSGFAHLFEHMLFQGSENVKDDEHFKLVSEAGGTLNGTTNLDRTLYYETLPSNQLELALWLEADRMGFLLPAMTEKKLDNQREVVRNERRQNYENRPYGEAGMATAAALFPAGHPYSWPTIGSHEDIEGATLEDIDAFFRRWYGPNNATLAVGGDVDSAEVLRLVRRWFGGISSGPAVTDAAPRPAALNADVRLVQEDSVQLPRLIVTWPGAVQHTADAAALELLGMVLSQSKSSLIDRALMVDEVLARNVFVQNLTNELAGRFALTATAAPGVELTTIEARIRALLAKLHADGIDPVAVQRMKHRREADFVRSLETVSGRTAQLAVSDMFTGDAGHFLEHARRLTRVTTEEVHAALGRYLVERPAVVLSVVPTGKTELAARAAEEAESSQPAGTEQPVRSARPGPGPAPEFHSPAVWHDQLEIGLGITGTPFDAAPLTTFRLCLPGGRVHESLETLGVSSLTAELMMEGTRALSTTELADELDDLGADLSIRAGDDEIVITLSVLNKHRERAAELLSDVILAPRLDEADLARLKIQRLAAIDARADNIRLIAGDVWNRLMRAEDSVLGRPSLGTRATIERLNHADLMEFHRRVCVPDGARLLVVGDVDAAGTRELLAPLFEQWRGTAAEATTPDGPLSEGRVFFVDKPGAAQSEVRVGHPSVTSLDPDWYPLEVLNYVLGGSFSSRINLNLREDKGYTYGARSYFRGGLRAGPFTASSSVHTGVTREALVELRTELDSIQDGVTEDELTYAQHANRQSLLRLYESAEARLTLVNDVSRYGWADDFPAQRLEGLAALTTDELRRLARDHIQPERLRILVVGDRELVLAGLGDLGPGAVIELDSEGERRAD
jgi:zinc protease